MTTESGSTREILIAPSDQVAPASWAFAEAAIGDYFAPKANAARIFSHRYPGKMAVIGGVDIFGSSSTKATAPSWSSYLDDPDKPIVSSRTASETFPLLSALQEMRSDLSRQGAAVSMLSQRFAHLAEEVHELRSGIGPIDPGVETSPNADVIEQGLAAIASEDASEVELSTWLNAAADTHCVSEATIHLAESCLSSSKAQVRAAAARVLSNIRTERSISMLRKSTEHETNKLAKAIMQSAVRALSI